MEIDPNNKLFLTFIVLIATFSITSCSEVEPLDPVLSGQVNSGNGNGSGSGSTGGGNSGGGSTTETVFKADFDGQTWNNASTIQAIVNSDYISISAMKSNGSFFQITIPQGTVGTYNWATATSITSLGLVYSAGSGQVPFVSLSNSDATNQGFTNYVDTAEPELREKISQLYGIVIANYDRPSAIQEENKNTLNEKLKESQNKFTSIISKHEKNLLRYSKSANIENLILDDFATFIEK